MTYIIHTVTPQASGTLFCNPGTSIASPSFFPLIAGNGIAITTGASGLTLSNSASGSAPVAGVSVNQARVKKTWTNRGLGSTLIDGMSILSPIVSGVQAPIAEDRGHISSLISTGASAGHAAFLAANGAVCSLSSLPSLSFTCAINKTNNQKFFAGLSNQNPAGANNPPNAAGFRYNTSLTSLASSHSVPSLPILFGRIAPSSNYVYAANQDGYIFVFDSAGFGLVNVIQTTTDPYGIAVNPTNTKIYFTNPAHNTVSVMAVSSYAVTNTIGVGSAPVDVAFSPTNAIAVVVNSGGNSICFVNTTTEAVVKTLTVGAVPVGVVINPAGTFAYVANEGGTVSVINMSTQTVSTTITLSGTPVAIAMNPAGTIIFVACNGSPTARVFSINTSTNIATDVFDKTGIGTTYTGIAMNNTYVFVSDTTNQDTYILATSGGSFVSQIGSGGYSISSLTMDATNTNVWIAYSDNPFYSVVAYSASPSFASVGGGLISPDGINGYMALNSAGTTAYVDNPNTQILTTVNTATNSIIGEFTIGPIWGLTLSPDGSKIYYSNRNDFSGNNHVFVRSASSGALINTISDPGYPTGLVINPTNTRLYVNNASSGATDVFDLSTNTLIASIAPFFVEGATTFYDFTESIVLAPSGTTLYLVCRASIMVVNPTTNTITQSIATNFIQNTTFAGAISPDGTTLYLAAIGLDFSSELISYNIATQSVTNIVSFGLSYGTPTGIILNPAGTMAFISTNDNYVLAFDISNYGASLNTIISSAVGFQPGMTISPSGSPLYLAGAAPYTSYTVTSTGVDPHIMCYAADSVGGSAHITLHDTLVSPSSSYHVYTVVAPTASSFNYYIDSTLVGTVTATLPTSATSLGPTLSVMTTQASSINLEFASMYLEHN